MNAVHVTLAESIAALSAVQASFVSDDETENWRQRLVQRRRRLQGCIADVAAAWQAMERGGATGPDAHRFRVALAQLRATVAEHQASWPAVSIDHADPRFLASRSKMRSASVEFHDAATAILAVDTSSFQDRGPL